MNLVSKAWLYWNWLTCIPLTLCCLYSFLVHNKLKEDHKGTRYLNLISRIILYPAGAFYILDILAISQTLDNLSGCNAGYLIHHVIALLGFNAGLTVPVFPWFFLLFCQIHWLLTIFPYTTQLYYVYIAIIIYCLYRLKQEPWASHPNFIKIFKTILTILCGPLPILFWFGCNNDLLHVG